MESECAVNTRPMIAGGGSHIAVSVIVVCKVFRMTVLVINQTLGNSSRSYYKEPLVFIYDLPLSLSEQQQNLLNLLSSSLLGSHETN